MKRKFLIVCLMAIPAMLFAANIQIGASMDPGFSAKEAISMVKGEIPCNFSHISFAPTVKFDIWHLYGELSSYMHKNNNNKFDIDMRCGAGIKADMTKHTHIYGGGLFVIPNLIDENHLNDTGLKSRLKNAPVTYQIGLGIDIGNTEMILRSIIPSHGTVRSILKEFKGLSPNFGETAIEIGWLYTF